MATLEENLVVWDRNYAWPRQGDEWSEGWGSPEVQWQGSLLPRLKRFLPAPHILEIAPGFGRWTRFLAAHCDRLTGVDLSPRCVRHCETRFAADPRLRFFENDGKSLPAVESASVDLIVSFDSLVHAEADVLEAYAAEFARVLKPEGVGLIHHSNLKDCFPLGEAGNPHWRAPSVSARLFREMCSRSGLLCPEQELVAWWSPLLTDCFSLFAGAGSGYDSKTKVAESRAFKEEALRLKRDHARLES
jgi:SAM-dependent methyltransferase